MSLPKKDVRSVVKAAAERFLSEHPRASRLIPNFGPVRPERSATSKDSSEVSSHTVLCSTCFECLSGLRYIEGRKYACHHHDTVRQLRQAAESGCRLCSTLYYLSPRHTRLQEEELGLTVRREHRDTYIECHVIPRQDSVLVSLQECSGSWLTVDHVLLKTSENVIKWPKSSNTFSPESIAQVKLWLESCAGRYGHESCKAHQHSAWRPSRLLDVRSSPGSEHVIHLIETNETPVKAAYATLSHCWGNAKFLQLRKANLTNMKRGLQIGNLSITFQHAIEVCRSLEIDYLWIDSLCILQDKDDLDDWSKEARSMGNVYTNAYLNIAATASSNSSQGLFRERCEADHKFPSFEFPRLEGATVINPGIYIIVDLKYFEQRVDNAPLLTRGWVLQERLLASRILHFTKKELMWECRHNRGSEIFPTLPIPLRPRNDSKLAFGSIFNSSGLSRFAYGTWNSVVESYSDMRLSFEDDKCVAISGIAKAVAQQMPSETYVLGMWKSQLHYELLWHVENPVERRSGRSKYPIPSFSWLSTTSKVKGSGLDAFVREVNPEPTFYSVIDVQVDYLTEDDTYLVTGGHLDLRGRLREICWLGVSSRFNENTFPSWYPNNRLYILPNWVRSRESSAAYAGTLDIINFDHAGLDRLASSKTYRIFAVPAVIRSDHIEGLILCYDNAGDCAYHRIGHFRTHIRQADFVFDPQTDQALFPCLEYNEDRKLHTFRIF